MCDPIVMKTMLALHLVRNPLMQHPRRASRRPMHAPPLHRHYHRLGYCCCCGGSGGWYSGVAEIVCCAVPSHSFHWRRYRFSRCRRFYGCRFCFRWQYNSNNRTEQWSRGPSSWLSVVADSPALIVVDMLIRPVVGVVGGVQTDDDDDATRCNCDTSVVSVCLGCCGFCCWLLFGCVFFSPLCRFGLFSGLFVVLCCVVLRQPVCARMWVHDSQK